MRIFLKIFDTQEFVDLGDNFLEQSIDDNILFLKSAGPLPRKFPRRNQVISLYVDSTSITAPRKLIRSHIQVAVDSWSMTLFLEE